MPIFTKVTKFRKASLILVVLSLIVAGYFLFSHFYASKKMKQHFPKSQHTFVGDPMPYYNGKDFLIYYLEDLRDNQLGFHPMSLLRTKNFYHYTYEGVVLPFINKEKSAERALGTGSIFQDKNKTYHTFYTGHNDLLTPKEKIFHATSSDGKNWQKIPEDTFEASDRYDSNDFRDPYVFWNEQDKSYWMLITTRANGTGVLAKYTSKDLTNWQDKGIFFQNDLGNDSNLECSSLVYFNNRWYLAFSDQWDQRVVHLRYSNSLKETFTPIKPLDHVDGAGFYAGRLVTDNHSLYLVGWVPTKEKHEDREAYNWGGNLIVHELTPKKDTLIATHPKTAKKYLKQVKLPDKTLLPNHSLTLPSSKKSWLAKGSIQTDSPQAKLAIEWVDKQKNAETCTIIDTQKQHIAYYNRPLNKIDIIEPQTILPLDFSKPLQFELIQEKDLVVLYINGVAFSNRIYSSESANLQLSSLEGSWKISPIIEH